jgi:hypothetical protein
VLTLTSLEPGFAVWLAGNMNRLCLFIDEGVVAPRFQQRDPLLGQRRHPRPPVISP